METHKEKKQEGKHYRITLIRFGKVIVTAASRNEAVQKAIHLEETKIHWLSEADGIPSGRLVGLIEPLEGSNSHD